MQEKFLHILFKQYGFTAQSLPVLVHGVQSMQNLKPAKAVSYTHLDVYKRQPQIPPAMMALYPERLWGPCPLWKNWPI